MLEDVTVREAELWVMQSSKIELKGAPTMAVSGCKEPIPTRCEPLLAEGAHRPSTLHRCALSPAHMGCVHREHGC